MCTALIHIPFLESLIGEDISLVHVDDVIDVSDVVVYLWKSLCRKGMLKFCHAVPQII